MLCRRCGMESTTTDVCEWCHKPMLAAGAAAAGRQARPENGQPETTTQQHAQVVEQEEAAAEGLPELRAEPDQESGSGSQEELLRPLGGEVAGPSRPSPGVPSHGLSDDATRTSVDLGQYLGADQSLFRPLPRSEHSATAGMDPLAQRRSGRKQVKMVSDVSDNTRLLRSLIAGIAISFPLTLMQFAVVHKVPDKLWFVRLGREDSFGTAILYGLASGGFVGFGLGALLVHFKRGPFIGLLLGLMLGNFFLATTPAYWGIFAGVLTGIVVGRIATHGYRRAVTV